FRALPDPSATKLRCASHPAHPEKPRVPRRRSPGEAPKPPFGGFPLENQGLFLGSCRAGQTTWRPSVAPPRDSGLGVPPPSHVESVKPGRWDFLQGNPAVASTREKKRGRHDRRPRGWGCCEPATSRACGDNAGSGLRPVVPVLRNVAGDEVVIAGARGRIGRRDRRNIQAVVLGERGVPCGAAHAEESTSQASLRFFPGLLPERLKGNGAERRLPGRTCPGRAGIGQRPCRS